MNLVFWKITVFLLTCLTAIIVTAIVTRLVYPKYFLHLMQLTYNKANSVKNRICPPNYISKLRRIVPYAIYHIFEAYRRTKKMIKQIYETSKLKNSHNQPLNEDTLNVVTNPVKKSTIEPSHIGNSNTVETDASTKRERNPGSLLSKLGKCTLFACKVDR